MATFFAYSGNLKPCLKETLQSCKTSDKGVLKLSYIYFTLSFKFASGRVLPFSNRPTFGHPDRR